MSFITYEKNQRESERSTRTSSKDRTDFKQGLAYSFGRFDRSTYSELEEKSYNDTFKTSVRSVSEGSEGSTSSSSTASSQFRARNQLKGIGLGSSFWPGIKQMRRVFRTLFDIDGKGMINTTQFKNGLEKMEFNVSNTEAIRQLFREVDKNHNGMISEEDFLDVFRHMNRKMLQKKLSKKSKYFKSNPAARSSLKSSSLEMSTTIIDLGKHKHKAKFSIQKVEIEYISAKLLEKPKWSEHVRWIDFVGYNANALELATTILKLPVPILEDMQFEQRAKAEFYSNNQVMQIVTHAVTLNNCPVRKKGKTIIKLQKSRKFKARRPKTEDVQIHIFILQDHTLVTFRKHHELSILNDIWDDIIPQLELHVASLQGPFLLTAKSLAAEILDEISEHNWVTRDQFKEWKINLEKAILENANSVHLKHIMDMQQCSLVAANVFKPNVEMMNFLTSEKYAGSPRVIFLSNYIGDFRDVFESFARLRDEIEFTHTSSGQLHEFYKVQQTDKMNRILYVLTVVTTIIAPMQLTTGIYGMNFKMMPDIHWAFGYESWWVVNILLVIIIVIWFKRKKFL